MNNGSGQINRLEAARLLQAARAAAGGPGPGAGPGAGSPVPGAGAESDAIDWAFVAMPERRAARRLKIHHLLQHGDVNEADALITQGLTARPDDPALTLLRARRLSEDGRLAAASRLLATALQNRPHHGATLALAGRVEHRLGHWRTASGLLRRALAVSRGQRWNELARELFLALLDGSAHEEAQATLDQMAQPPADLTAMLLAAQGRPRDAAEVLKTALAAAVEPAQRQVLLCRLIEILGEIADTPELTALLQRVTIDHPAALERAGLAWLSLGLFRRAIAAMRLLGRHEEHRRSALTILIVAAAMIDRHRLADRALAQLRLTPQGVDVKAMAEAWRRGLKGRIIMEQQQSGGAGADPSSSQLLGLLDYSVRILDSDLAAGRVESTDEKADLRRFKDICLAAMADRPRTAGRMPRLADADWRETQTDRLAA